MSMQAPQAAANSATAVHAAYAQARAAFGRHRFPAIEERHADLDKLAQLLRDNAVGLQQAISTDFGNRSIHETQLLELFPALAAIRDARRHLRKWMRPRRSWASLWFLPARRELRPQPLGVAGIIVPWNYPLLLAIAPLVGALAAGNRVLIKMSEFTPHTGELLARLIAAAFPVDQITVINGDADTAREFSALPFDHLLFTGSTSVGRQVMAAAARNLTPVTLELGGKSPAIIGPEADLAAAADKILFGKCLNAGQTCIAPDYVLLPRGQEVAFIEAAKRSVARLYPDLAHNADYTSIVNDRHFERLHDYLADADAHGATVTPLAADAGQRSGTRKIAPTIVHGVDKTMLLMQEEIFGPILPLLPYDALGDAIAYVNDHPRPLALYYFGDDLGHIGRVLDETVAGGVTVNETLLHISQDDLPFGGVGPSGMGAYHGKYGFDTFSKQKPVFYQSKLNGLNLLKPPYGERFNAMIKWLLK
ncbi:MAG TPA: coniferyl aldehyde dehydrogenase [Usitatibacteraceae bacterium]